MTLGIAQLDPGYDSVSQTVSELSAVGAPTRPLWVALGVFYTLLVSAFGWSVLRSAGPSKGLAVAGRAILAYGLLGVLWVFAPMHLRETLAAGGGTASDTMHLVLAGVTVALMVMAILSAAAAIGGGFRVYSIVTLVVLLFFGFLTGLAAPRVSANLPTPWLGVWERVNIGAFLSWIAALALVLLGRLRGLTSNELLRYRAPVRP